jgi:N6-adenosine-specific RNA methylase IME4
MKAAPFPVKYSAARKALAAAHRIDEVKKMLNQAIALAVYARQANDAALMDHATEIRLRAERRAGELMEDKRAADKLAKGARQRGTKRGTTRGNETPASLAAEGVDKDLAKRARAAAAMSPDQFEERVAKAKRQAIAAVEGDASVITEARADRNKAKGEKRAAREIALAGKQRALPNKKYGVILADPEWRYEPWDRGSGMDRAADNHYPTSPTEVIAARPVGAIAADDSALFLCATAPMLLDALAVMEAWGFKYKTHAIWIKGVWGPGYWFRGEHELLLLGVRGNVPCPAPGHQWGSVIKAPRGAHSAKPEAFQELIEAYFPTLPKIELNRRGPARPGWDAWGNEASDGEEATTVDR